MRRELQRTRIQISSRKLWRRQMVFWGGALATGGSVALFVILGQQVEGLFREMVDHSSWLPFLLAPAGLVVISLLTRHYFPNAQGSGIPQTVAALEMASHEARKSLLSLKLAAGKFLLSLLGLLCGASVGRGGPAVHIGSSILFSVGRYAHFPRYNLDYGLILAGGAAGLAAVYNAPLAGIFFAIEELSRSINGRINSAILGAILISGVVALLILGEYSYFGHSGATLPFNLTGLGAVLVCGLAGGVVGGLFASGLIHGTRRIAPHLRTHPIIIPALCGLALATLGLLSGNTIFGTGYYETQAIIAGEGEFGLLYPFLKMLATVSSFLAGIPGGIFGPSLATGAGLGAGIAQWFPAEILSAVILLGIAGYFAGMIQTPITAFVIIMEMTDNQQMLLPLMATAFIAFGVSKLFCPTPIYQALARDFIQRGEQ